MDTLNTWLDMMDCEDTRSLGATYDGANEDIHSTYYITEVNKYVYGRGYPIVNHMRATKQLNNYSGE